jgi:hypothetical protein
MRLEKYLTEMPKTITLDSGILIDRPTIKKFKKKFKNDIEGFLKHIQTRASLSSRDERLLRNSYEDI